MEAGTNWETEKKKTWKKDLKKTQQIEEEH